MFKKFNAAEDVSGFNQAKSSVIRAIRARLVQLYPPIEQYLDDIIPKKEALHMIKCRDHIELMAVKNEVLFFHDQRDENYIPTLKLLHKYPTILPRVQVDKGAIKFVLSGANIMCPGLTSPGGKMETPLPENTVVAVMAEGKEHALCIGITKMSTEDIATINKGIAIESIHFLRDGLWVMKEAHT